MSFFLRPNLKRLVALGSPDWFRLPQWLTGSAPDVGHQTARVRSIERNIILPVKGMIIIILTYYLFFSKWFEDVYTFHEAVFLTVRLFFLIYAAVNLAAMVMLVGMDELPFKFVRGVVLSSALIDALFWGAMIVVTNGFDSNLYWLMLGLIIRNAVSIPVASTQIVLNLLVCVGFVAGGLTEWGLTQVEPDLV